MSKKIVLSVAIVGVVLVVLLGLTIFSPQKDNESEEPLIVANPLDLSQIDSLSKFRSCVGHDYSGKNANNETESLRSMKHYIDYKKSFKPNDVNIYAPFDGEIRQLHSDKNGQLVYINADAAPSWNFLLFHVQLLPDLSKGSTVKAGQRLGFVHSTAIANFDMGMRRFGRGGQATDSPFSHMSPNILAEYAAVGITPENSIVSKEARDADPCPIVPGTESKRDTMFPSGDRPEDWTTLAH